MNLNHLVYFLPGEKVVVTKTIAQGILILTNYRLLIFSTLYSQTTWSIPIPLLLRVDLVEMLQVKVMTKLGTSVAWSFADELACEAGLAHITSIIETSKSLNGSKFACEFRADLAQSIPNHPFLLSPAELLQIDACFEFRRMNFNKSWKITDVNEEFKICSSYPRHHIVPRSIHDNDVINMANFRSHNRFSSVVWRSQNTGAVLLRCAQPCVGLMYSRNEYDEKFLRAVLSSCQKNPGESQCPDSPRLLIVDARNYSTAQFNRLRGGGFEYSEYYDQAQIRFMDLPNLHIVRVSFERLTQLYASKSDVNWYSMLEKTSWLTYIGQLLKAAIEIACALEVHGRPVMVHCTDGWDRTPQLCSLAQLLADPFYRTIKGFRILIEREWLQFGHKFADRNGQCGAQSNVDERSPIFLQWLDCVHQICKQFPHCFEFNESFILKMGLHIYSALFGTFMYNSERERRHHAISSKTCSLWALLSAKHNWTIVNYLYEAQGERLIKPNWEVRALSLWTALYETALDPVQITAKTRNPPSSNIDSASKPASDIIFDSSSCRPTDQPLLPPSAPLSELKRNSSTIFDFDDTVSSSNVVLTDLSKTSTSRRRSLGDLVNIADLDVVHQPSDSGPNVSQPAILKVSSFTDDAGFCTPSNWMPDSSHIQSAMFGDGLLKSEFKAHDDDDRCDLDRSKELVRQSHQELDSFAPLEEEDDNDDDDDDDDELDYLTDSHHSQQPMLGVSSLDKSSHPISIGAGHVEDSLTPSPIPSTMMMMMMMNRNGIQNKRVTTGSSDTTGRLDDSPQWSVNTLGSSASLYVCMSDVKHSSPNDPVKMVMGAHELACRPEELNGSGEFKAAGSYSQYTIQSLPENEGLLINEADFVNYDGNSQSHLMNEFVNLPRHPYPAKPLFKPERYLSSSSNTSLCEDFVDKSVSKQPEDNLLDYYPNWTKTIGRIVPNEGALSVGMLSYSLGDLNTWCSKYFRAEPLSKLIPPHAAWNNEPKWESLQPVERPSSPSTTMKTQTLRSRASFDALRPPEQSELYVVANNDYATVESQRTLSAPISPIGATQSHHCLGHMHQVLVNSDSYLLKLNSQQVNDRLTLFTDWDGLSLLVDRLTIRLHTKVCQERFERKHKKHLITSLKSKQREVTRLNMETQHLQHLLENASSSATATASVARTESTLAARSLQPKTAVMLADARLGKSPVNLAETSRQNNMSERRSRNGGSDDVGRKDDDVFDDGGRTTTRSHLKRSALTNATHQQLGVDEFGSNQSDFFPVNRELSRPTSMDSNLLLQMENRRCIDLAASNRHLPHSFEMVHLNDNDNVALQPDLTAHECPSCRKEFSDIRLKYHCRQCGFIYCDACSNRSSSTTGGSTDKSMRVCRRCYMEMYSLPSSFGQIQSKNVVTSKKLTGLTTAPTLLSTARSYQKYLPTTATSSSNTSNTAALLQLNHSNCLDPSSRCHTTTNGPTGQNASSGGIAQA